MRHGLILRGLPTGLGIHAPGLSMRANVSVYSTASCFLLSVASILYLVSFASPYWFVSRAGFSYMRSGLWTTCQTRAVPGGGNRSELSCGDTKEYLDLVWKTSWIPITQAAFTMGLITLLAGAISSYVYLFISKMEKTSGMSFIITCSSVSSFGFSLVGYVIYAVKDNYDPDLDNLNLSWCFGLNVTASFLVLSATVLFFLEFTRMLDIRSQQKDAETRLRMKEATPSPLRPPAQSRPVDGTVGPAMNRGPVAPSSQEEPSVQETQNDQVSQEQPMSPPKRVIYDL